MNWIAEWGPHAACLDTDDADDLFVSGAAQNRVKKALCSGCRVRSECLAEALDNQIEYGVWGGMTERERRALLRRRPEVRSWAELLRTAKDQYEHAEDLTPVPHQLPHQRENTPTPSFTPQNNMAEPLNDSHYARA